MVIGGFLIGIDLDIGVQNGWRSKFLCHSREVTYYLHWHGGGLSTKVSRVSAVGKMHHLQSCGSVCMYRSSLFILLFVVIHSTICPSFGLPESFASVTNAGGW